MKGKTKNYLLLFVSIFIVGFAITLITKAGLGATAVTSLAFVISQFSGLSFGIMTALFNILWVVLQMLILKKEFPKVQLLQILVAFILGFAVDFADVLLHHLNVNSYGQQLALLFLGCILMGFGVFLQLKAATVYNPAEGIVAVISETTQRHFSTVKTIFDSTLVVSSLLLSLLVTGQVVGVREGTIVSALLIGPITGFFQRAFHQIKEP